MTAPIDRIVRSRVAYERLLKRVAVLERKVREQGAELRELRAAHCTMTGRRGLTRKDVSEAETQARVHRCDECGANPGEPCRFPTDQARPQAHHLRGRTVSCGRVGCWECRRLFDPDHSERGT